MAGKHSMELHQQLDNSLIEGRKRLLHMWGLIKKIQSVNSMVLNKRDEAKEHIDTYVTKLSECLLDFRSEMMKELEAYLKKKQDDLEELMKKYEDDVETLIMLVAETEKLKQFGKNLENSSDREKAISLLQALEDILSRKAEELSTKDLFHFDVKQTIELDKIKPIIFGHRIIDNAAKNIQQEPHDDIHEAEDLTGMFKKLQCCMTKDTSGVLLQDSSTQTTKLCGDVGLQTEESQFSKINGSSKEQQQQQQPSRLYRVNQEIDTSILTGCNYHFSPPPGLPRYPVFPAACQTVSPISMMNNPLPNIPVSPILLYNHCMMTGPNVEQVNTDVPVCQSKRLKSNNDSKALSDEEHGHENNIGNERQKYPPGFSADVLSSIHNANRSSVCSSFAVNTPGSLYLPPPVPNTARDINLTFNDIGANIGCHFKKEPLIHPLNIKKEACDNFQHSTPVKSSLSIKSCSTESNNQEKASLGNSWQSFINCPTMSTASHCSKLNRKSCGKHQVKVVVKEGSFDAKNLPVDNSHDVPHLSRLKRRSTQSVLQKSLQALKEPEKDGADSYTDSTSLRTSLSWDDKQIDSQGNTTSHLGKNLSADTGCSLDHGHDSMKDISSDKETNTSDHITKYTVTKRGDNSKDDSGIHVGDKNVCGNVENVVGKAKEADSLIAEEGQMKTRKDVFAATTEEIGLRKVNQTASGKDSRPIQSQIKKRKASRSLYEKTVADSVRKQHGALQDHWLRTCHVSATSIDMEAKFVREISANFYFPIGLSTNSEKHIIVTDTGNHVVKKLDKNGKLLFEFGRDLPMRRPSAVVVNDVDSMFIKDDTCIHVFDKDGQHIRDIGKSLFKRPFGLAMTPDRHLLVLETHSSYPSLVYVTQDGMDVRDYLYVPLVNAHPLSKCRFLGISDNNVIVSDLGLSQVYITTFDGVYLKRVGSFGSGIMQFYEPSGISVDNYGNLVIGDSKNNRIQIYRYDGSYAGILKMDKPILRPSGVHLTADNKLLVVNYLDHRIKVYQL